MTDSADHLPDILQFMQMLWNVAHNLERVSKRMRRDVGVTGPQRLALRVVGLRPGVSAGDLALVLHIHPSTVTGIVQRLVAQGLLTRVAAESDRRRAVLRLTAHGARVNRISAGTVEAAVGRVLTGLSPLERATSRRVLERLAAALTPAAEVSRRNAAAAGRG